MTMPDGNGRAPWGPSGVPMPDPQPQPLQAGMHVQPGPMTYVVGTRVVPGGQKIVILHVEHATGSTVLPMAADFARGMADALAQASTGIQIAR